MISFAEGIATVRFPWPTNDTGGKILREMSQAALSALQAAGYIVTTRPTFQALERSELGYEFVFTVPATVPTEEVAP